MVRTLLVALAILTIFAVTVRYQHDRRHHHIPGIVDAR